MHSAAPSSVGDWQDQTETLIGFCGLGFAVILLILFEFSGQGAAIRESGTALGYAVWIYTAFCLTRLIWVTQHQMKPLIGWGTALIDVLSVSVILYVFSQTGPGIETPIYTLYYALIAMHAMRLNAILVLCLGISCILASVFMGATLLDSSTTLLPSGEVSSKAGFMGTEVEKLLSLMAFIVLTAIGVMRARSLLAQAGLKDSALIRMEEFKRASTEKTKIMSQMGQDLQAPMTDVQDMVEAMRGTKLSSKQTEFLDAIEKSGGEILSIIDDIVDYTNLELGELEVRNNEFNLRKFIEKTARDMGEKARIKGLDLLTHVVDGAPDLVVADEERLRKVLVNLIDNAIKYTDVGSISVTVEARPLDGKEASLFVSVKDTGIGIAEDNMELIFAPAALPDGAGKRRYGVMGLGLSVSRGIIRANGGDIRVVSMPGKGSEFSFEIRVSYKFISSSGKSPFGSIKNLDKVQILIVDDQPASANILEKKLNEIGMMPKIVTNAEVACTALTSAYNANKPFEFALVDYDMPDWNGLQLTKLIRTRKQLDNMGIIAFSAVTDPGLKSDFQKAGVTAFLEKPFRQDDLHSALFKALQMPRVTTTEPITGIVPSAQIRKQSA